MTVALNRFNLKVEMNVLGFLTRKLNLILALLTAFLVVLAVALFYWTTNVNEAVLIEQTLHREQVIARSGALSIESFLKLVSKSLLQTAYFISEADQPSEDILSDFVSGWADTPVTGTVLTDEDGVVQININKISKPEVGTLLANRPYFIWAKEAARGKVYVSEPIVSRLGASKGQSIITISTPIVQNAGFRGVLVVSVLLKDLTSDYLDPLKISERTQVNLLDSDGNFLHFNYLSGVNFPASERLVSLLKERLKSAKEGKVNVTYPDIDGTLRRYLVAYAPINYANKDWLLAISTPVDDAMAFYRPFSKTNRSTLAIFVLVVLAFAIFTIVLVRIAQKDAFARGYNRASWPKKAKIKQRR